MCLHGCAIAIINNNSMFILLVLCTLEARSCPQTSYRTQQGLIILFPSDPLDFSTCDLRKIDHRCATKVQTSVPAYDKNNLKKNKYLKVNGVDSKGYNTV